MWRIATTALLVVCALTACSAPRHVRRVNEDEALEQAIRSLVEMESSPETRVPVGKLSDFGYELGISVDSVRNEREGRLLAKVFVFNRADRTWILKTASESFRVRLRDPVRDEDITDASPAGANSSRCPSRPENDVIVVGPGERRPMGCFESALASDEVEIVAELHFRAVDGTDLHLSSPPFRIARLPR